jgi:hypothetical protein
MIYDISKHKLHDLLHDERLLSEVMKSRSGMTTLEAREKIQFAYEKCDGFRKPEPEKIKVGGMAPCWKCGSTEFFRSGTCHTCSVCFETTGCS